MDDFGLQPPPPPTPPIPPLNSIPQVPKEEPQINRPSNQMGKSVKRNGIKIVGGILMAVLIIGGAVLGTNLLQEKQRPVEKQAAGSVCDEMGGKCVDGCNDDQCGMGADDDCAPGKICCWDISNCSNLPFTCQPSDIVFHRWDEPETFPDRSVHINELIMEVGDSTRIAFDSLGIGIMSQSLTPINDTIIDAGETYRVSRWRPDGNGDFEEVITKYYAAPVTALKVGVTEMWLEIFVDDGGGNPILACKNSIPVTVTCTGAGTGTITCNPDCPTTCGYAGGVISTCTDSCGGTATKSCVATAACPSPSPSPTMSCVGLTKNKATPVLNDKVIFSCEANFSATAPVAEFRWKVDTGEWIVEEPDVQLSSTRKVATFEADIYRIGTWTVQCKVCTDNTKTSCTAWGEAN